jgi:hypothetical protein
MTVVDDLVIASQSLISRFEIFGYYDKNPFFHASEFVAILLIVFSDVLHRGMQV